MEYLNKEDLLTIIDCLAKEKMLAENWLDRVNSPSDRAQFKTKIHKLAILIDRLYEEFSNKRL